jgi:hypothetical protein
LILAGPPEIKPGRSTPKAMMRAPCGMASTGTGQAHEEDAGYASVRPATVK